MIDQIQITVGSVMAEISAGYGSECHLLRYLGRHRNLLDKHVLHEQSREALGEPAPPLLSVEKPITLIRAYQVGSLPSS